jgi:His/Glu/Gln/Arg/opine family amino acid ABC transporter permease subunit
MLDDLNWAVVLTSPGRDLLVAGLLITLQLAFICIATSTVIGVLVAMGRVSRSSVLAPMRWALTAYVEFFRNVPLLVQLVFWSFGVFSLEIVRAAVTPLNAVYSNQFLAGVCGLTVYSSTYVSEVLRSGLQSVPKGQMEAARASGLTYGQAMRSVILPQMVRIAIPPMGNQYISITKNTSVVLVIGVADVVFQAKQIEAATFRGVEAFTAVIAIFMAICLAEMAVLRLVNSRLGEHTPPAVRNRTPGRLVALESE